MRHRKSGGVALWRDNPALPEQKAFAYCSADSSVDSSTSEDAPSEGAAATEPSTTCPVAYRFETWVTLILTCWPCFAPATKMTKPSIFAMPSPRLLTSEMVTSYSYPTSTGLGLKDLNPPAEDPPPNPPRLYPPRCPKLIRFSHPTVVSVGDARFSELGK